MTRDIVLLLQDSSDSVSPRDWGQGQCLAGRFSFADIRNAVKMRAFFRQNHKVSMLVPGTFSFFSCILGSFSHKSGALLSPDAHQHRLPLKLVFHTILLFSCLLENLPLLSTSRQTPPPTMAGKPL